MEVVDNRQFHVILINYNNELLKTHRPGEIITYSAQASGFEINARPLAGGDWKRGMSRIFAQVVRRASGYFNLFCQLCVTMNETNY